MTGRRIMITRLDFDKLKQLVSHYQHNPSLEQEHLKDLEKELRKASILDPKDIPPHVITMNSRFLIRSEENNELMELTLVFPQDADIEQGKISVLAPVGTALLGYAETDRVCWQVPGGVRIFTVEKILYQPEASGKDLS